MRFALDRPLGKLAKWLRILGYDALYWRGEEERLLELAKEEGRVLITKTRRLGEEGKRGLKVVLIGEDNPFLQLREVMRRLGLRIDPGRLFKRCLSCNVPLQEVTPEEVEGEVPDYVFRTQDRFSRCPVCGKVFWPGTHYERMKEILEELQR